MKRRYGAILFDLDGTLLDTLQDLGDAMNRALQAHGFPPHPREAFRFLVGEGVHRLVEMALPADHRDPDTIATVMAEYRRDYAEHWNVATRPYDGIPELLKALRRRKVPSGVLSNKPHPMTVRCVEGYFPGYPFGCVLGQRESVARKPDPEGALEAAGLLGVIPSRVLFVGDTSVDMQTARAAGMFALGATWGFRPADELLEYGAQGLADHPSDILSLLT